MGQIDLLRVKEIDQNCPQFSEKIYMAAVYYASQGMYVLPLLPGTKKLPGKHTGITYAVATKDPTVIADWFGSNGDFKGYNLGIACGKSDGVMAVDLDRSEFDDGVERFYNMADAKGEVSYAPTQNTPSGGKHVLFNWFPYARSSASKIGMNIDTRGGSEEKCGGHIVAWPSKIQGKEYQWERGGEISPPPSWICEALGKGSMGLAPVQGSGGNRGNENTDEEDYEQQYTLKELSTIIKHIDIDDITYDQWLWVGQAIHSQHPGQDGLELWDEWSSKGERYVKGECKVRWSGFNEMGEIRVGTLVALATSYGYNPRTRGKEFIKSNEQKDDLIAEMNKMFAVAVIGGSVKVIMERDPTVMDPLADRFSLLDRAGFCLLLDNEKVAASDKKGNPVVMNKSDIWLADEGRRTYPGGIVFTPGGPKEKDGCYNSWQPWPYRGDPSGSWDMFRDHILRNICKRDKTHYEWVLDWMADIIQEPRKPKGTAIILSGNEGNGKGTFCHVFGKLFGIHYKHVTDEEHLIGRFNGHLQDSMLVFADEVTYGGSKKTAGKLKSIVTEPHLVTERKGVDAFRSPNYIRLVVASNERWFIPAGPSSRRWFVLTVGDENANDRKFFGDMHDEMDNGGYDRMFYDLKRRKIKSNLREAPVTEGLKIQRAMLANQDSAVAWWSQCLEQGYIDGIEAYSDFDPGTDSGDRQAKWIAASVPSMAMYEMYEDWCLLKKNKKQSIAEFASCMQKVGLKKVRARRENSRIMAYRIPNHQECIRLFEEGCGITVFEELQDE